MVGPGSGTCGCVRGGCAKSLARSGAGISLNEISEKSQLSGKAFGEMCHNFSRIDNAEIFMAFALEASGFGVVLERDPHS